jgi:hypothetical protein
MTVPRDIHAYLGELEDIPGTRVLTAARARQGYQLNQFAMSLMKAENREGWKADERAYLDGWKLSEARSQPVGHLSERELWPLRIRRHTLTSFSPNRFIIWLSGDPSGTTSDTRQGRFSLTGLISIRFST